MLMWFANAGLIMWSCKATPAHEQNVIALLVGSQSAHDFCSNTLDRPRSVLAASAVPAA